MFSDSPEKILIIDDDRSFADALAARLTAIGMETKIVCDPLEGMDMLRDGLYGIVVVDPEKNISALEEISGSIPRAVILATATFDSIESSAHALKAGAIDLLPEKLEPGQLETIIRRALDRRSLLEETVTLKKRIAVLCVLAGVCFFCGFLVFYLS
jgi:DNA-binding NtrC family response regulator